MMNWFSKFGYSLGIVTVSIFILYKSLLALAFGGLIFDNGSFDVVYFIGTIESLSFVLIGLLVIEKIILRIIKINEVER